MDSWIERLFLLRTIEDEHVWFSVDAQTLVGDNQREAAGTVTTQAFTAIVHDFDGSHSLGIDGDDRSA